MALHIAIVGAGLIGRVLAFQCLLSGIKVSLFDRDNFDGKQSCAYTGAGMLAPYTELEQTEPIVAALGVESLLLWPKLLQYLGPVFFQHKGTLVLAHRQDSAELARFDRSLSFKLNSSAWQQFADTLTDDSVPGAAPLAYSSNLPSPFIYKNCTRPDLLNLEPDLPTMFNQGIYLPREGQIDNRQLLNALKIALQNADIDWQANIEVALANICDSAKFDFVIDCRGLQARLDFSQLRGVRGELIVVEARGVHLNRPIRLMHPRHPIYIVPRENNQFLIGATSIESDDTRPLTVQSALELLSAACTIHSGFAEGAIMETRVNCRPALPNNLPAIIFSDKHKHLICVNGLYRHGFLISPKLSELVVNYIKHGKIDQRYKQLFLAANDSSHLVNNGEPTLAISH